MKATHQAYLRSLYAGQAEHDRKLRNVARFIAAYVAIGGLAMAAAALLWNRFSQP